MLVNIFWIKSHYAFLNFFFLIVIFKFNGTCPEIVPCAFGSTSLPTMSQQDPLECFLISSLGGGPTGAGPVRPRPTGHLQLDVKSPSQAYQGQSWAHTQPCPHGPHHLNNPILLLAWAKNLGVTHDASHVRPHFQFLCKCCCPYVWNVFKIQPLLTTFTISTLLPPTASLLVSLFGPCFPPYTVNSAARVTL